MRWKIIIVNAGIMMIVGLLSYVLLMTALRDVLSDASARRAEVERALRTANSELGVESLRLERWLAAQAADDDVRAVYSVGTASARGEGATKQATRIRDFAMKDAALQGLELPLVLFVDNAGVALGRNNSNQMRGDEMAKFYPSITAALKSGQTASAVWLNRRRAEQMLASYAPVRGENGEVVGALIAGTPLSDERISAISEATSGFGLAVAIKSPDGAMELVAKGGDLSHGLTDFVGQSDVLSQAAKTLGGGFSQVDAGEDALVMGAAPLNAYGGPSSAAVLIAGRGVSLVDSLYGVLWPVIAVALLGMLLVGVGGALLGSYISRPISELEDGLLAIINGKTDLRFQLEHPDLGGLVFRINSLLNSLMGVPETDEEGRTSRPAPPYRG